ncbi:MAG: STAS domain-containing protein [Planctomycetota bacterium]|nr:STAS domain-containing protein [Planctomycetota bacterium]
MDDTPNIVKEVRKSETATVVALSGDVDLHHAPTLHATLVDIANGRPKRLIVNLEEVPYMDSSGVGTLVEILRRVTAYKGTMALVGLNPRVRSVFEITKLDKFFTICDTEQEALDT